LVTKLTPEEHAKLQAACTAAEARARARFVTVAMPVSDRYTLFPLVYGAIVGLAAFGIVALFWNAMPLRTAFPIVAGIFVGASALLDWLPLRLLIVPRHVKRGHAHDMAHRAFAAHILAHPEPKPGVLFFVSLGERYVEVIAGRGVHQLVPQETWDAIVTEFSKVAREGRIVDGLLEAIESCAKVLETHQPAK
jgi:putative membrane protein